MDPTPISGLSTERVVQYTKLVTAYHALNADLLLELFRRVGASSMRYMALVDFSKPSTDYRLFLIDTQDISVESYRVAHGSGHDSERNRLYAQDFSNKEGSWLSSLGYIVTGELYESDHPFHWGVRLNGKDPTNDAMLDRGMVLHGAVYVEEGYVKEHRMAGQSNGCLAVAFSDFPRLRDALVGGSGILCLK